MLAEDGEVLVPVDVDGRTVMISVRSDPAGNPQAGEWEQEVVSRRPSLQAVFRDLAAVARELGSGLQTTGADKVNVEFGCEFAIESGTFIAVIGKAGAKSTFTVGLEWSKA